MRIGDVLKAKPSTTVVTIGPEAGVRDLLSLLAEHNVGALIVSTDGSSVDGGHEPDRLGADVQDEESLAQGRAEIAVNRNPLQGQWETWTSGGAPPIRPSVRR